MLDVVLLFVLPLFGAYVLLVVGLLAVFGALTSTGWTWAGVAGSATMLLFLVTTGETVAALLRPTAVTNYVTLLLFLTGTAVALSATTLLVAKDTKPARRVIRMLSTKLPAGYLLLGIALAAVAGASVTAYWASLEPRGPVMTAAPEDVEGVFHIILDDTGIKPQTITMQSGKLYALFITNTMVADRVFSVPGLRIHERLPPGSTILVLLEADIPGDYAFYISPPGHEELGFQGTLRVTA
jgi:uncharacterized cupredoxin-like copper-binding protein